MDNRPTVRLRQIFCLLLLSDVVGTRHASFLLEVFFVSDEPRVVWKVLSMQMSNAENNNNATNASPM